MEVYGGGGDLGYSYAYAQRRAETMRMVTGTLPPPAKILDVAAAQGNFSLLLAEEGYHVTWNDLRDDISEYVQLKHQTGSVRFAPGNIFDLQFSLNFDLILATEVIEHVAHPDRFLKRLAEMLRPGGFVLLTTPNGGYFRNQLPRFSDCRDPAVFEAIQFKPNAEDHIFLIHSDEIDSLAAKAGLVVKEVSLFGNPLTNGRLKTGIMLRMVPPHWIERLERWTRHWPTKLRNRVCTELAILLQRP